MYSLVFLGAAIAFAGLALFIFFNYPKSWRQNSAFVTVLIIWHVVGLTALTLVFTAYKSISAIGVRYEIARLGTCYFITTTIMAFLFAIRDVSANTYRFIMEHTGTEIGPHRQRFLSDKRVHSVLFMVISFAVFILGYFNIDFLHSTSYEMEIPVQSAEEELTICLISDIHVGSGTWEYTYDSLLELSYKLEGKGL